MVWPLYVASALTLLTQVLPSKKANEAAMVPSSSVSSARTLFYTGILTGMSLGYLLTAEFQRRRIWEYWRLKWHKRNAHDDSNADNSKSITEQNFDGITIQPLVSPRSHRTSQFHVDMLTIPPKRRLKGRSQGVEWYHVVRGNIVVQLDDKELDDNGDRRVIIVIDPFVERTIYNPSSTVSAVVYRAADGVTKDVSVDSEPTTNSRYKAVAAMMKGMSVKGATTFDYVSSIIPFTKRKKDEGTPDSLLV
ncbi:hypothetical protein MHU86_21371 [Fragilaria crotonensis]|nr:hypothetical protein MHU86_21371 [Fragilaria crotonensis]